ncbi:MAG: TatD family hydrolase [Akkermansiaceae bacterium]
MQDAHNHLQDSRFDGMRERVINDMSAAGITRCVVNGTCPSDWEMVAELAQRYPDLVIPSFGLHPWKKPTANWYDELSGFLKSTPNACIGECGLDRWIAGYDIDLQKEIFTAQLDLAAERNSPLSIHCLKAWGAFVEILEARPLARLPRRGFLLHSYSGSAELIPRLAKLGAYFSISGYFLQSRKKQALDAFQLVPADRLLIETDAPDMLPPDEFITHPLADGLNHPANLVSTSKAYSRYLDTSMLENNFMNFFINDFNFDV